MNKVKKENGVLSSQEIFDLIHKLNETCAKHIIQEEEMLELRNKIKPDNHININNKIKEHIEDHENLIYKILELEEEFKNHIINKDILIDSLHEYDEILLIGSGKGVASIQSINNIKWKRKSLRFYRVLFNIYKKEILNCSVYR